MSLRPIILAIAVSLLALSSEASARVLNSHLGRWLSRDRMEYIEGQNLYGYVRSSPVGGLDYSGLVGAPIIRPAKQLLPPIEQDRNGKVQVHGEWDIRVPGAFCSDEDPAWAVQLITVTRYQTDMLPPFHVQFTTAKPRYLWEAWQMQRDAASPTRDWWSVDANDFGIVVNRPRPTPFRHITKILDVKIRWYCRSEMPVDFPGGWPKVPSPDRYWDDGDLMSPGNDMSARAGETPPLFWIGNQVSSGHTQEAEVELALRTGYAKAAFDWHTGGATGGINTFAPIKLQLP